MNGLRRHTGLAARRILTAHLKSIGFVMFVLLIIALAIDLAKELDSIRTKAIDRQLSLPDLLLPYISYRATDIITRLLPMACLIGAFATEMLRHQRLEDVILSAAGTPPSVTLGAMCAVGLVVGMIQTSFEGWLRPNAVFAQVEMDLGRYADRFRSGQMAPQWFLDGDRAMRATVLRDANPELRDINVFQGVGEDGLSKILTADRAHPSEKLQTWTLENVTMWDVRDGQDHTPQQVAEMQISFPLTPAHLQYHGILGFYLPNSALTELTSIATSSRSADAQTAIVRRYAALFLPGLFALLGVSLAQASHRGRLLSPFRLLALGAVGYVSLVTVKVFWALGEFGQVGPVTASFAPLIFAFLLAVLLQLHSSGYLALRRRHAP